MGWRHSRGRHPMSAWSAIRSAAASAGSPASTASPRTASPQLRSSPPTGVWFAPTATTSPSSSGRCAAVAGTSASVTALELRLYPIREVYAGILFWPIERSSEILEAWRRWTEDVPEEVTSVGRVLQLPPIPEIPEPLRGRSFVIVEAIMLLEEADGADLLRPLRGPRAGDRHGCDDPCVGSRAISTWIPSSPCPARQTACSSPTSRPRQSRQSSRPRASWARRSSRSRCAISAGRSREVLPTTEPSRRSTHRS